MMKKPDDLDTQRFIKSIEKLDNTKHQILEKLREIVIENYPKVKERFMYGGIMLNHNRDFGGLFVYQNHVSFEFSNGYKFNDPEKLLEGKGKHRRHLKIRAMDEIETKKVDFFVKQSKDNEK